MIKNVKNDTRYIIKKIIIGVGIALILANINKCNVFADSISTLCPYYSSNGFAMGVSTTCTSSTIYSDSYINIDNVINYYSRFPTSSYEYLLNNTFYNSDLDVYTITESYSSSDYLFNNPYNYIGLADSCRFSGDSTSNPVCRNNYNNFRYFWSTNLIDLNSPPNWDGYTTSTIDFIRNGMSNYIYITKNQSSYNYIKNKIDNSFSGSSFQTIMVGNVPYYVIIQNNVWGVIDKSLIVGINTIRYGGYTNYTSPNDIFYIWDKQNNVEQFNYNYINIPSYFSEINLSNYQGVYFIPKDYSSIPTFTDENNVKKINFDFYLFGSVNSAYFNIENTNDDFVFNTDENLVSFSGYDFYRNSFPFYFNDSSDDLSAYMLFNTGNETKVMYDSRYFDYYLVSDLTDYVNEIIFIDENGEQVSKYISFTDILADFWNQGFQKGGDLFDYSNSGIEKIKNYIELLKLPFHLYYLLLEQAYTGVCHPIQLPIPKVGGTIQLDCLSTIFNNVLTPGFYLLIKKCLNLVYLVLFTIWNVKYFMDALTPNLSVHTDTGGLI